MGPLKGIRVFDFTVFAVGAVVSKLLADLGADVIKVEPTTGDPLRYVTSTVGVDTRLPGGRSTPFESFNRNKRSLAIDMKSERGLQIAKDIIKTSDVFVENFGPGVVERLGLSYDDVRELNPEIIYVSCKGYGTRGPDKDRPAFDYIGLARTGMMWSFGAPDDPPFYSPAAYGDVLTGTMGAMGAITALCHKANTGKGQRVDASMLAACMWAQTWAIDTASLTGKPFPRYDRSNPTNPIYNHYECADGKWLALALLQRDRFFDVICVALGRDDLLRDERFATAESRLHNAAAFTEELDKTFKTKTRDEWEAILSSYAGLAYERVQQVHELLDDEQVRANEFLVDFEHQTLGSVRLVNFPVQLSGTPAAVWRGAPDIGEHNESVLSEILGMSADEVQELTESGVLGNTRSESVGFFG